ncbi:MAG: molybdopterin molybdotransferase MoeA [Bacteroidetes bacterium]|nr:molybdopterin molybdotransferase MoeA [Bacteroidota bacterium]MDA1120368.1 molybdopterin molybdotransferase MoeA [Bacteroidota bacterium]
MISVSEAEQIILNQRISLKSIQLDLNDCINHMLDEDIFADRDFPPFDRVTMDGIALSYSHWSAGQRKFAISGVHTAGSDSVTLNDDSHCLEVMTGAILPVGTDTVVRYEDIEIQDGWATIVTDAVKGQNIHRMGTDRKQGDLLIKKDTLITPAEIGVLATVGKSVVRVKALPKIAIISTGDELIDVQNKPLPHQIRKSNVLSLKASLQEFNISAGLFHSNDDLEGTIRSLESIISEHDVVLLSGGVSKGKADYVPEALEQLGIKKLFHRIKQRPGKPFWFGTGPDQKIVFAFPGNPVSTFLCYYRYFIPWLQKTLGQPTTTNYAALWNDFLVKPNLTYFLQVKIISDPKTAQLIALPMEGHGSGDHANLLDSDAFIELPEERSEFKKGEVFRIIKFKE